MSDETIYPRIRKSRAVLQAGRPANVSDMHQFLTCISAQAQHLWWNLEDQKEATCLYGEITVLATHHGIYYCGANWHPGEPAGGYCGI